MGSTAFMKVEVAIASRFRTAFPVSRCTPQGCLVEGVADNALVTAMKEETQAEIAVTTPEGKRIPIALALNGFAAAFGSLD